MTAPEPENPESPAQHPQGPGSTPTEPQGLGSTAPEPAVSERAARAAEAERRRRRDRVFGAVLADTTADERGHGSMEDGSGGDGSRDAELRRNVPPHHG